MNMYSKNPIARATMLMLALFAMGMQSAFAAGGATSVNSLFTNINSILQGAALIVVTVAFCWAGFKMIWGGSSLREVGPVLIGAVVIGSAGWIASQLIG